MYGALIILLLLPQYVRKPFVNGHAVDGEGHALWKSVFYQVPLTLDGKGEGVIRYKSLYPGDRYTQSCQPDETTRDKKVRFFSVEEDAEHIHIGTEPKRPGMKVTYSCTVQVGAKDLQRSTN